MDTSLPQNESDPVARAKQLAGARDAYRYDYQALTPIAMVAEVPKDDDPALAWVLAIAELMARLALNSVEVHHAKKEATGSSPDEVRDDVKSTDKPLEHALEQLKRLVLTGDLMTRGASVADFTGLFIEVPKPTFSTTYLTDQVFSRMRVAGPNPMQIQRVRALDDRFPVTDAVFQSVMGPRDSLAAAGEEGRLFLADYAALDGIPGGTFPVAQKYLPAPLALFATPQGVRIAGSLIPVAIQLGQRPGADNPIFTPADGVGWMVAKSLVQTADGNAHQAIHHLAHTHLVLEPIAIATYRRLATAHPVAALLRPHFEGTLYINNAAVVSLLPPKGGVDTVMAGQIDAVQAAVAASVTSWVFNESMLPDALRRRGVDDAARLGDYPYRDDALLIWDAIRRWVASYLAIYYQSPADLAADVELQAWIGEIVAPDGGRMKGIGQNGRIETLDYLTDALTLIVFTAGAQHAAVNFPQDEIMSYTLGQPLASYAPPPTSKGAITEQTYWDLQPPLALANYQLLLGKLLGGLNYTRLGVYPRDESRFARLEGLFEGRKFEGFTDPRVNAPLAAFQTRLTAIEAIITERNAARAPYTLLLPSKITQSINI